MVETIHLLTEVSFLLLLLSALAAGGWAFYNLLYKNSELLKDDFFTIDLKTQIEIGFESVNENINELKDQHRRDLEALRSEINKNLHES